MHVLDVGKRAWQVVVRSSAIYERSYYSMNDANMEVFTDTDSIFSAAPRNGEIVTLNESTGDREYALRWDSSLLTYFRSPIGNITLWQILSCALYALFINDTIHVNHRLAGSGRASSLCKCDHQCCECWS